MPKITKRVVDAAIKNEDAARYYLWDSEIRGFGLLVTATGQRSYIFQYRTREGRTRRATIGKHGAWTPELARRKAEEFRRAVREGRDPLEEKNRLRNAPTVTDLLDLYVQSERFLAKTDETRAIDRGRIERHLKPLLGRRHVHTLTMGEVERAFAAIRDGKTFLDIKTRKRGRARVRGGAGAARMCIRLLKAVFNWGIREGLASSNPCQNIVIGRDGIRSVILEDASAYSRLFFDLGNVGRPETDKASGRRCHPFDSVDRCTPRRDRKTQVVTGRFLARSDHHFSQLAQDRTTNGQTAPHRFARIR